MNCKPGDLAIIIMSRHSLDIGKVVEVVRLWPIDTRPIFDGVRWLAVGESWEIKSNGKRLHSDYSGLVDRALIPDHKLRPISGIPNTEDTDIEQPIREVA